MLRYMLVHRIINRDLYLHTVKYCVYHSVLLAPRCPIPWALIQGPCCKLYLRLFSPASFSQVPYLEGQCHLSLSQLTIIQKKNPIKTLANKTNQLTKYQSTSAPNVPVN